MFVFGPRRVFSNRCQNQTNSSVYQRLNTWTPIGPTCKSVWHIQTDRQAGRQTDRQTDGQTDRQTDRRTDGQAGRQADRQAGRQTDRQTGRQAGRQTGRQTDRQTDRQESRQTDRQTAYRHSFHKLKMFSSVWENKLLISSLQFQKHSIIWFQ